MEVVAEGTRIGRIVNVLEKDGERYLRVETYGVGGTDLYLPTGMIEVIGKNFVSLYVRPSDLVDSTAA